MRSAFGVAMVALLVVTSGVSHVLPTGRIQTTPVVEYDGTAESLLSLCPCQPSDNELFNAFVYPSDLPMNPAPDPGWTDEERRTEVANLLDARFEGRSEEIRQRALDAYGEATAIMDVRLAAGLVMLVGTSGEPAVDVILEAEWESLGFGEMTRPEWTAETDQSGPWKIVINEQLQHEDFLWFSSILLHEALHSSRGDGVGREEEAAAFLLQRIVLAELLAEFPDIAQQKTSLSRGQLTFLLALVFNSATVFEGRGDTLYPGGVMDAASIWEDGPAGQYLEFSTLAPPVLAEILDRLGVDASAAPDTNDDGVPDFTTELLDLLVIDQIVDSPDSRLSGDALRFIGTEVLTIAEFPTGQTPAPTVPVPPTSGPTVAVEVTSPTEPTPDDFGSVQQPPPPTSPPPSQPQQPPPTSRPPPPPPPPPPPTRAPPPPPPTQPPPPPPTSVPPPQVIPTTAPPQTIPTTAPVEPIPTTAPPDQDLQSAPAPTSVPMDSEGTIRRAIV